MRNRAQPLFIVLALVAAAVIGSPNADAQSGERIESFDSRAVLRQDGRLDVTETIVYDFGPNARHGIFRDIIVREPLPDSDDLDRIIELEGITVSADPGTPDQLAIEEPRANVTRLRIGDPTVTIAGVHTYTIRYTIIGIVASFDTHEELFWDATGTEWEVPIEAARVVLTSPATIERARCLEGRLGSQQECTATVGTGEGTGFSATYQASDIGNGQGMTVVAAFPKGSIQTNAITDERPASLEDYLPVIFAVAAVSWAGAIITGIFWWRRRRRKAADYEVPGIAPHLTAPIKGGEPIATEFAPPDDLRPAELGTVIDASIDRNDLAATLVDLAQRGFMTITESGTSRKPDWTLKWRGEADQSELHPYEYRLLSEIFRAARDGSSVEVSDLKGEFSDTMGDVADDISRQAMAAGWFERKPKKSMKGGASKLAPLIAIIFISVWALPILVIAAALLVLLWPIMLIVLPWLIVILVVVIVRTTADRRGPKGNYMARRALGFKKLLTADEGERMDFAERTNLFHEYLPYAVAFGVVDRWAQRFAGLHIEPPETDWYRSSRPFDAIIFASAINSFSTTAGTSLSHVPASSGTFSGGSSGFSGGGSVGGGGGGGGGGSW